MSKMGVVWALVTSPIPTSDVHESKERTADIGAFWRRVTMHRIEGPINLSR